VFVWGAILMILSVTQCFALSPGIEYLSDLRERLEDVEQSWGLLGFDTAAHTPAQAPLPIRIKDRQYAKGLGTHANSQIVVALDGEYKTFEAEIGLQWQEGKVGTVIFQVFVDGRKCFDSGVMRRDDPARPIRIRAAGARSLRLVATDAGDGIICDGANWAEARLIRDPRVKSKTGAEAKPMDIAPFARVMTCDPERTEGARSGRLEEFRAEDVFLEWEIPPAENGAYTVPVYKDGRGCIGLQWAERRVLAELSLQLADAGQAHSLDGVQVQYWSSAGRVDGWGTIGQTLWQGRWEPLPGKAEKHDGRWIFHIAESVPEFQSGAGVQKVRWLFPPSTKPVAIRQISALSRSKWAVGEFQIESEKPMPGQQGDIEIYNGYLENQAGSPLRCKWDLGSPLRLKLRYTALPKLPDRTVIRLQLPDGAFGVAVEDVLQNGCVYIRDFGVFVTCEPARISLAQYKRKIAGRKTVLERVREMPDQTFVQAMKKLLNPASNHDPMLLSLACDNHKFAVERQGTIRILSPDHFLYYEGEIRPRFGSGKNETLTRHLEGNWLPVPVITVKENGIIYRQRTFVTPYDKEPSPELPEWLNRKPLCVIELTVENSQPHAADATLSLSFLANRAKPGSDATAMESLLPPKAVDTGIVVSKDGRLFAFADTGESAIWKQTVQDNALVLSGAIPAQDSVRCVIYIPGWAMSPDEHVSLQGGPDLLADVKAYWERVLAPAMQVKAPEPLWEDIYRASQMHCLMAARNERDGALVVPWIASVSYGPLDTESQAVILGMDAVGHLEFARRALDYFISRYNPDGLLANGYTLMGTGQHLWTLAHHYGLAQDRIWLKQVAPRLEQSCRWIVRQCEKTRRSDAHGEKMPEHGLVPPGVLADWERYAYYFYANGYYYMGLKAVASALQDIGYPGAQDLLEDAERYRADILRAYRWNQARMPVLPLSDGTRVPAYPSSVYCFGLTRDFYKGVSSIGHDVEVGGQHLINHGVLDPTGQDAEWITNYMEDVWFSLYPGLAGYPPERMKKEWFTCGGFSKLQPYYTRNADIYALRDDVKPFIRTYFNTLFPMLSTETLAFWEHFNTTGAWNKTHETGWFLEQTRLMLVMERGDDLWLAPFVTNHWLKDGMEVVVKNAPTRFGPVSYRIRSHAAKGYIEAIIEPPARNAPRQTVLRLRHPQGKKMQEIIVNGSPHSDFDPVRECIRIKPAAGEIRVKAKY